VKLFTCKKIANNRAVNAIYTTYTLKIEKFTFNYFSENTYVLYDETLQCVIVDPGCSNGNEERALHAFITEQKLKPVALLNTHCHIDHILGNAFVAQTWDLKLHIHQKDLEVLQAGVLVASRYGFPYTPSPMPAVYLEEGETFSFGNTVLDIIFTPGHSPGSICFINHAQKILLGGDVLFQGSIGRTDLPGGDHNTLLNSIQSKLYTLDDAYIVYAGHGDETTIGEEKKYNPFVRAVL
jgi:glyoxylase-like metal-dependent hydrolase (beta-lactamase superfamily II)